MKKHNVNSIYRDFLKRVFDCVVAILISILFSPLLIIISVCVKSFDRGPIFFRQKRVGLNGVLFSIVKFKTMSESFDGASDGFAPGSKSRITRLGGILRSTKLDELPQLWNVLKGDMSLVGPRPEVPFWVEHYPEKWVTALSVRPGITDNAAIVFRQEEELLSTAESPMEFYKTSVLPQKLELYQEYAQNVTFLGDLKILLKTCFAVLFR